MITSLCLLRSMQESGESLSKLNAGFRRYPQTLVNVRVREKRPFAEVPEIRDAAAEVEAKLDGQGRLLLRYSGTEPLARIMIEGSDQTEIEGYARNLASVIQRTLGGPDGPKE